MEPPRIGIDIGRVIIDGDGEDSVFLEGSASEALDARPVHGALGAIERLVVRARGRVWLVSKCSARVEERTRAWLSHQRFFEKTGLARESIRFVRTRAEKALVADELGLNVFIDDRQDILLPMMGVRTRILFGAGADRTETPGLLEVCRGWPEVELAVAQAHPTKYGLDLADVDHERFSGILLIDGSIVTDGSEALQSERLFVIRVGGFVEDDPVGMVLGVAAMRDLERTGAGALVAQLRDWELIENSDGAAPGALLALEEYGDGLLDWYIERVEHGYRNVLDGGVRLSPPTQTEALDAGGRLRWLVRRSTR